MNLRNWTPIELYFTAAPELRSNQYASHGRKSSHASEQQGAQQRCPSDSRYMAERNRVRPPYAPTNKDDIKKSSAHKPSYSTEPEAENAYASFQGLLALAKITNSNSDEARGACKRCGRVGHLYIHCRNFLSVKDDAAKVGKDDDLIQEVVLEKLKGEKVKKGELQEGESSEDEEEEDSESSDSDYDSEMERIIAERAKKASGKVKVRSRKEGSDDKDESDRREKRGRSKKRRSGRRDNSDSEDEGRRRKQGKEEKRRRRDDDESSDVDDDQRRRKRKSRKERRRRRSHRHSSDDSSEASPDDAGHRRRKRSSRRTASTSEFDDPSGSDDPRVGRDKKRSEKKSRKGRHEDEG